MDGHADLIAVFGITEPFSSAEAVDQGELFSPDGQASNPVTLTPASHQVSPRNFFLVSSVANLESVERSQFVESCLRAQENERLKLGRELHDSTGQLLLALRLEIARLREVYGQSVQGELLDEIEGTVREIDREIRAFSFTHYPAEIGRDGLGPALRSLARGFASRTGLRINFSAMAV